jgi:hypothetical protein
MGLSRDHVEQLRLTLKAVPKAPAAGVDTTKQEAVKLLAREIEGLQRRGYSLEQIAEMLKGGGLIVSTPTLKSYLSRAKTTRERGKGAGRRRKAAGDANAPATAGVASVVKADASRGATPKTTGKGTPPAPGGASAPDEAGVPAVKATQASLTADAAAAETPAPTATRGGKDAFLIKDKDSY